MRVVALVVGLLAVPLAVVGIALGSAKGPTPPMDRAPAAASHAASSVLSIDLGRVICGDCCVGNLWKALGTSPGVRDIDAKAGNHTFFVYYDAAATQPDRLLATLIAAGEAKASLSDVPADAAPRTERRWVRPARR